MYTRVVVLSSVSLPAGKEPLFDYHLSEELIGKVEIGSLVTVPFARRSLYAIVMGLPDRPAVDETRPVASLVDPRPVLTPPLIELARWMSREYLAPLWRCCVLMLPPGVVGSSDVQVELAAEADSQEARTESQEQLITVLGAKGPLRGRQLDRLLPREEWSRAAEQLARRGVVTRSSFLAPPRARPKQIRVVEWVAGDIDVDEALAGLRSECYPAVVAFLRAEGEPVDVSWVYAQTGCQRHHLVKLAERGYVAFDDHHVWRDPLADELFVPDEPPILTPDQATVWERIHSGLVVPSSSQRYLLYGVTGSGKTEIYLRSAEAVLAQGRQAIVLVPEISLTPQTSHRFGARFGRRIAILHSALTAGERYDAWRRVREGLTDIVIGPRSALFAPFSRLGLIVLDEEHSESYKQGATAPLYHARDTALKLAETTNAAVIMGSATPSLESYHRAQRGEFTLLEMPHRVMGHARRLADLQRVYGVTETQYAALQEGPIEARYLDLPPVHIVDMRAELKAGNRSMFSRKLEQALEQALARGEQAILFLNRRGQATFVLCRDCGYVVGCPHCDVPLTLHGRQSILLCHYCGHREPLPSECPSCGGTRIRHFGLGTERVEQEIHERWSDIRTLRWDRDTATNHAAHGAILHLFSAGLAQVLVGTQMVAKGLDLPLVTVVGVISADTALNLPDFRSAERTFQLLEQVAGRAGRGLLGGRVVIQTYHPDHYAVRAVEQHDYEGFSQKELAFRRRVDYPPYVRMARLITTRRDAQQAQISAEDLATQLRAALTRDGLPLTDLIGPAPAFFSRLRGQYRWQILLRHADPPAFLRRVELPAGWRVDVDPVSVL